MDPDQEIRFRVENDVFVDVGPVREKNSDQLNASSQEKQEENSKSAPYTIIASAAESGLGLLSWWE
jgi:DNA-directed RNA polymerase III subunit RPC8